MAKRYGIIALACLLPVLAGCTSPDKPAVAASAFNSLDDSGQYRHAESPPLPRISPQTHSAAGRMLERQGEFEAAVAQYEKAIASEPRFEMAYNWLGILYQKLGQLPEAERVFKAGLRAIPGSTVLRNNLGYCHLQQARFSDAEEAFRKALVAAPEFQRARMNLAIALAQQGRTKASVAEFERVVPTDTAYYNVGVLCLNRDDYAAAEQAFRQALAVNPDCPGAKERLDHVAIIVQALETGERELKIARALRGPATDSGTEPSKPLLESHGPQAAGEPIPLAGGGDAEGTDLP